MLRKISLTAQLLYAIGLFFLTMTMKQIDFSKVFVDKNTYIDNLRMK